MTPHTEKKKRKKNRENLFRITVLMVDLENPNFFDDFLSELSGANPRQTDEELRRAL